MKIHPVGWLILLAPFAACAQQADWVHFNSGRTTLVYSNDDLGNHLIDYSYAGYEGGGVALPTNQTVQQTLSPFAGDNTTQIQNAINTVGGLTQGTNGVRGVVLLNAGVYNISGTLSIGKSGVILRGSGNTTNGTVLNFTGTTNSATALNINGSSGATQVSGSSTYNITNTYVPLGATNFNLNSISGLAVGNTIVVRRPWTTKWINAIGMSNLWSASGHQNDAERTVVGISGNKVTVDIPLPTPIEQEWCTGTVFAVTDSGRVQQCGVENLRMVSQWGLGTVPSSTNGFGWTAINFGNAKNCWVHDVAFDGFGIGVNTGTSSQTKWCTVQDCSFSDGVNNGSARPPAFQIQGQMCLFQRLNGISGFEHFLQTADEATGPNVYLYSDATGSDFDGGPHRYWAVSLLTDNEYGTVGNVHIVIVTGGGNGWGAGYSVFYNCHTSNHTIQCPAVDHHYNWWIGGSGINNSSSTDPGVYDHDGTTVQPTSLYLEQLKERLGGAAVENIGYQLFSIAATPTSNSIVAGATTNCTVNIGDPTLMSNAVVLGVSGLPTGATAGLSTNTVSGVGTATLTIATSASLAPGSYPITVTGTSAGLSHSAQTTLVVTRPQPPVIATTALNGGSLVLSGSNGVGGAGYYLLAGTNLSLPISQWAVVATNSFDSTGHFILTNPVDPNAPQSYFLLQLK